MEVEVRAVGGVESCFASLPLFLIQALESTSAGPLPLPLALELRSRAGGCWHLAWTGSSSKSSAIELDGRVKTLHPNIHGGILARRDHGTHVEALNKYGVVVNLYRVYEKVFSANGMTFEDGIENTDIGGPTKSELLLRITRMFWLWWFI